MSDYTPSMDEIRADWVTLKAARELGQDVPSKYWHAFDRAIAAHDAELRAEFVGTKVSREQLLAVIQDTVGYWGDLGTNEDLADAILALLNKEK